MRLPLLALLFALLLTGCVKEPAAYLIEGGDHSITIERNKPYFWSDGWELDLVVARYPECQRRHELRRSGERLRVDLYDAGPGIFILNQGKRWYVAETRSCQMQQYEQAPPEPGQYLGSFREKNDRFDFQPEPKGKPAR